MNPEAAASASTRSIRGRLASPVGRLGAVLAMAAAYYWLPDPFVAGTMMVVLSGVAFVHAACVDGTWRALGMKREGVGKSALLGTLVALIVLTIMKLLIAPGLDRLTHHVRDLSRFDSLRGNTHAIVSMLLIIWITAAFAEEILFRGFLLRQLTAINDSNAGRAGAALVSAVLFGLAHTYQGISGVLSTGLMGLVFSGLYFARRKDLWFTIFTHGVVDTVSILLIYTSLDRHLPVLVH